MRHDREPDVRSYAVTHHRGTIVLPQPVGWDQLLHASSGVMTVVTAESRWVVAPSRAVWVPSGHPHHIELSGRVSLRSLYLATGLAALGPAARAVRVSPLLRELVLHVVEAAPLWLADPASARLAHVLLDQVDVLTTAPLQLRWPRDGRAQAVAERLTADPGGDQAIAALAHEAGASVRTIQRLFRAETGMTLQRWRIRARLLHGLRLMADGATTTGAGVASGYRSPSAFVAAFQQELGTTPRRYLADRDQDRA